MRKRSKPYGLQIVEPAGLARIALAPAFRPWGPALTSADAPGR